MSGKKDLCSSSPESEKEAKPGKDIYNTFNRKI